MLRKIQQKALQLEPVDEIKSFNQFIRLCSVAYKVVRLTYECKILPFMAWRTSFGEQNLVTTTSYFKAQCFKVPNCCDFYDWPGVF